MTPTPPVPTTSPAGVGGRDWLDLGIEWASGLAAAGMFAYGVCLSYQVLHAIAAAAALPRWAASLWPLGFEAFMASAALNALAEQRHRRDQPDWWRRVPWYPWTLTALTAGGSIGLNWFHPAIPLAPPPSWLVSLVYGLPPLIAVFAWHLFLQRVAHRRHPIPPVLPAVPVIPAGTGTSPADWDDHQDGGRDDRAGTTGRDPAPPERVPARGPSSPPEARWLPAGAGPSRPAVRSLRGAATAGPAAGLLARARAVAAEHEAAHARPIGRDALRRALGVSNQTAGTLLRALRANADPPNPATGQDDTRRTVPAGGAAPPAPEDEAAPTAQAIAGPAPTGPAVPTAGGNGHAGRPVALVPARPGDDQEGADGDA